MKMLSFPVKSHSTIWIVPRDYAGVAEQDRFPLPEVAVCHTPLPAYFCTCGRSIFFEAESEESWN